jgi:hypothetical protein
MPRIRVAPSVSIPAFDVSDDEQGESLDDALSATIAKPKRKSSGASKSKIDRAFKEFDELFKGNRWKEDPSKIKPEHAVAFYVRLHVKVYSFKDKDTGKTIEVYPEELRNGTTWLHACSAAKAWIEGNKQEFENRAEFFKFIIWTWQTEMSKLEWTRKTGNRAPKRITWQHQFVFRERLTDYRQAMAEAKERGKRR